MRFTPSIEVRRAAYAAAVFVLTIPVAGISMGSTLAGDAKAGATIITRAVEAIGGAALVDGIQTITVTTTVSRVTLNGPLKTRARSFVQFPASFRQEIDMNGGTIAMASSPEGAYLVAPNQAQPLSDAQRHNLEVTALRNPLVMLKGRHNSLVSADADGDGKVGGVVVDFVNVYVGNEHMRYAIDKVTGRIVQQEFDTRGGVPERAGRMVVSYSDFRKTAYGITIPHASIGRFDGEVAFETGIDLLRINDKLPASLFSPGVGDRRDAPTRVAPGKP